MIHAQYAQEVSAREELGRAINILPGQICLSQPLPNVQPELAYLTGLAFIIYFTFYYATHPLCKAFLAACSTFGGSYMVRLVNHAGFLQGPAPLTVPQIPTDQLTAQYTVMKLCPVLGTLWIWAIVQLELVYAVASLGAVAGYVWWCDLKLVFG